MARFQNLSLHSFSIFFFIFSLCNWIAANSAKSSEAPTETVTLAPIVVEGSTADVLLYDPIVPTQIEKVVPSSSSGSVVRRFEETLPLPVTDFGQPGRTTQLRGLGRTVEDTNVQTLGVPLNPVVGGGFDFSTFPEYFWSSYSFHLGPSTGGFDPRAASSTLSLTPWTADALRSGKNQRSPRARFTEMVSLGLNQASVAGRYQDLAALMGLSSYNAEGPTGSVSARIFQDEKTELKAHLLGTSLDVTSPGPNTSPTPNARLKNTRWIPILEASFTPSQELLIKESAFYDRSSVRFVNPDNHSFDSYDRSNQVGSETVVLWNDWTFGFSLRRTSFTQIGGEAPNEWISHAQADRQFHFGEWTTQASVQADWMNLYGARPGASLGERYDITRDWGVFAKGNFSYRYPTLQGRYYQSQSYTANPDLTLERALSFSIGTQWKQGQVEEMQQVFLQFRSNAQLLQYNPATATSTVVNGGDVRQLSYWDDLIWHAIPYLDVTNSLRLSSSRIDYTGARIPYDPILTEIAGLRFHERSDDPHWNAGGSFRVVTSSSDGLGGVNGGYALLDLQAGAKLGSFSMQGRVDNVLDRRIQVIQGYPWPGRIFSLSLMAYL
jgi:hypothetical protein